MSRREFSKTSLLTCEDGNATLRLFRSEVPSFCEQDEGLRVRPKWEGAAPAEPCQ